jgi:signal transduction histidine kinase/ligand-binding sensor domain-containing protein
MITYFYNNENGLVSNLAKSISQDNEGYIWIATDAGLSRFDGSTFLNFQNALPSLYVKDIAKGSDNKIKVVSDLGIGDFAEQNGVFHYQEILRSSRQLSADKLYYPKHIFEDSRGTMWISDLSGISTLQNGVFHKIYFDEKYHADSYFRSFSIVELAGHEIYASSLNGYLFVYDERRQNFTWIPFVNPKPGFTINALYVYSTSSFLIGTSDGLYLADLSSGQMKFNKINNLQQISAIAINEDNDLFVGTWADGLYSGKLNSLTKYKPLTFSSIKSLFVDKQNNLWAASDDGIAMMKKTRFGNLVSEKEQNTRGIYIQQILTDKYKTIYYSDESALYKIENQGSNHIPVKLSTPTGARILSFAIAPDGFWISYRDNHFEYRDKNSFKVLFSYNLKDDRLNSLFADNKGYLWAWLGKRRQIIRISPDFKSEFFDFKFDDADYINFFKQSEDGTIYCAGYGINSFIFKFDTLSNRFVNLIPSYNNQAKTQIQVFDLQFIDNGKMLLATSVGVLLYKNQNITSYMTPAFFGSRITKAILFDKDKIWLGTDKGILYLSRNDSIYFDRQDGLNNSSIIFQGLKEDADGNLWVATANGVCLWQTKINTISKTPDPFFSNIMIGGKELPDNYPDRHEFLSGTILTGSFISLCYPSDRVLFRYRLIGFDSTWSIPHHLNTINLYGLPSGNYVLQIQAKSPELYWSNIVNYSILIVPHWYFSSLMISIYMIVFLGLLAYLVFLIMDKRLKRLHKRGELLQELVNQRTNDLLEAKEKTERLLEDSEKTNRLLEEATVQKSHMLSITSHDLKNPLQSIIGFSEIILDEAKEPDIKNMGGLIYDSSKDMLRHINEILDTAAIESKNLNLNMKNVSVNDIIKEVVRNNNNRALQKKQKLQVTLKEDNIVTADEHWLKIAIDNIVSNAIKYSPFGKNIYITSETRDSDVLIKIKDEGQGLTEEDKQKMFTQYQRLSARPTDGESSTGLGLSIVKDIIEFHKGKVWVESKKGEGAEFIIQLPGNQ